ncbi:hypothetical protein TWF281_011146 [Arthrobotrys megalospora]
MPYVDDPTESTTAQTIAPDGAFIYESKSFAVLSDVFKVGGATVDNLAFGYSDQTDDTVNVIGFGMGVSDTGQDYPTFLDGLVERGYINTAMYSLWISADEVNDYSGTTSGTVLLGGVDTFKYQGHLKQLTLVPNSETFTVKLDSVSVLGANSTELWASGNIEMPATITTENDKIGLPYDIVNEIVQPFGGTAASDGTWTAPCLENYDKNDPALPSKLVFRFSGTNGTFSIQLPAIQFLPRLEGWESFRNPCKLKVMDTGLRSGKVVLGRAFLRQAYTVFDTVAKQVFMAQASYITVNANIVEICSPGRNGIDRSGVPDIEGGSAATAAACNEPPRTYTSSTRTPIATSRTTSANPGSTRPPGDYTVRITNYPAIIGISVGCGIAFIVICVATWFFCCRRRRKRKEEMMLPAAPVLPPQPKPIQTIYSEPIEMTGVNMVGGIVSPDPYKRW